MSRKRTVEIIKTGRGTLMTFECAYPDENPEGAVEVITRTLEYLGVFDGLKKVDSKDGPSSIPTSRHAT